MDCGLGRRGEAEKSDALMREAPDDLYSALTDRLTPEQLVRVAEVSRNLRGLHNLRCYAAPSPD